MGLGKGGAISQKIYPDPYGLHVWKQQPQTIGVVYMVSSAEFRQITGHDAPKTPVTFEKYRELGLPWFELYDKHLGDSQGSKVFETLKPVTSGKKKKPHEALEDTFEDEEEPFHPPTLLDKKIFFYK